MVEIAAGTRLGQYRLLLPIGAGGMGRVWAALDEGSDEQSFVAIKLALEEGADTRFWTALADEADVAARIQHPNVCRSHGLGVTGDLHYLVMELSDGASLRDWLDAIPEKRLPPSVAAQIGIKIAAGLHAAHELADDSGQRMNVVHRDVSPQNVLVDRRGRVRLADFGVAKARGQLRRPTETGEIKGKLSYMAPEQITSKQVDARADVFALGCVLYEATLGVRPFHGGDALTTMYAILEQPVRAPREIDPSFPSRLEAVLLRALEKQPDQRYQSAAELQSALVSSLDEELTAPGDRHVARALATALGRDLEARHQTLCQAAERVRRGESLEAPSAPPAHSLQSTTPVGMALSNERPAPRRGNRGLLGVALASVACLGIGLYLRQTPAPVPAARPEVAPASPAAQEPAAPIAEPLDVTPVTSATTPRGSAGDAPPTATSTQSLPRQRTKVRPTPSASPEAVAPLPPKRTGVTKPPRIIDQSNPFNN